jgi:hypothetical protein
MATPGSGHNVRLSHPINVWFDEKQPNQIHLTLNDPDLSHPTTGRDGLHFVVSSNPKSADFNPHSFNTLRYLLQRFEKQAPENEADESIPRRIDRRGLFVATT